MVGFGDERRGELDWLRGREIPSELAQVVYRVDRAMGEGGMSVTARRPGGQLRRR